MLPHLVLDRTTENLLNHVLRLFNATTTLPKAIDSQAINAPVVFLI
jgi:hypothetical protein